MWLDQLENKYKKDSNISTWQSNLRSYCMSCTPSSTGVVLSSSAWSYWVSWCFSNSRASWASCSCSFRTFSEALLAWCWIRNCRGPTTSSMKWCLATFNKERLPLMQYNSLQRTASLDSQSSHSMTRKASLECISAYRFFAHFLTLLSFVMQSMNSVCKARLQPKVRWSYSLSAAQCALPTSSGFHSISNSSTICHHTFLSTLLKLWEVPQLRFRSRLNRQWWKEQSKELKKDCKNQSSLDKRLLIKERRGSRQMKMEVKSLNHATLDAKINNKCDNLYHSTKDDDLTKYYWYGIK